jgi:hypothetical protein
MIVIVYVLTCQILFIWNNTVVIKFHIFLFVDINKR